MWLTKAHTSQEAPTSTSGSSSLACCLENKRCGNSKANKWNELFINPVVENPEAYFKYDIKTRKIIPIFKEKEKFEKAEYTINLLNLNDNRLCEIRNRCYILFSLLEEVDQCFIEIKGIFTPAHHHAKEFSQLCPL